MNRLETGASRLPRQSYEQRQLFRDRLDAQLHQELQLVTRLIGLHSGDDGDFRPLRFRPVGPVNRLNERLDIATLPVPHLSTHGASVADVKDGVVREALAQGLDVLEPLLVEAIGEVTMPVVVDLVAQEDDPLVVAENPGAVVRRLARTKIDDGETDAVEILALAVANRRVRENA